MLLTRRENTLYVHLSTPARADAVLLPPISETPARAVLLNTGAELRCSVDVLPVHWESEARVLAIKDLPRNMLAGGEPLVIRLEFERPLDQFTVPVIPEFEG